MIAAHSRCSWRVHNDFYKPRMATGGRSSTLGVGIQYCEPVTCILLVLTWKGLKLIRIRTQVSRRVRRTSFEPNDGHQDRHGISCIGSTNLFSGNPMKGQDIGLVP